MISQPQPEFSIVVPVYGCNKTLSPLCSRLSEVFKGSAFEIILVDDKSSPETWDIISGLAKSHEFIKGVELSRNFGQHYAITCGLNFTEGNWVVVMDCDLQDVPEEIPKLIAESKKGYDIVFARRHERKDSFFKKLGSKIFYSFLGYLTDTKQDSAIANFGIYHKKVIESVLAMEDQIRYFPTMVQWVGFKKSVVNVEHSSRTEGNSSYSLKTLLTLAFNNIIAFSDKPLRLTIKFGLLMALVSLLVAIYYLIMYLNGSIVQLGFTSLILSIWFLSGTIIVILGIIGSYVGKSFEKVKNRPTFIVRSTVNVTQNEK